MVMIAGKAGMFIEQAADILPAEQATLHRTPREQRIISQLSEIIAEPLVNRETEALFRAVQQLSRQIRPIADLNSALVTPRAILTSSGIPAAHSIKI